MSVNPPLPPSLKPTSITIPTTAPLPESSSPSAIVKDVGATILGFVREHPLGIGVTAGVVGVPAGAILHACSTVPPPSETTVEKCRAKIRGREVGNPIDILAKMSAKDEKTGFVITRLRSFLPSRMQGKFGHAILCGAHVVLQNVKYSQLFPSYGRRAEVLKSYPRTSSHYDGKTQFGIDVLLSEKTKTYGHLLVGKTESGEVFFQLEKHGTGLLNILPHMYDFVQHKWGGNVQVGPLGYVQSSEKNSSELVVGVAPKPRARGSSTVITQRTPQ